jgi:arylsulfatase A-like enzyme
MTIKTNVLLITIDTLRADHLGCFGYHRSTSPNMDELASKGVVCENMFCAAIPTHPSYTTLYTGQHPIMHGIIGQGGKTILAKEAPFLPEIFIRSGYTTCAVDTLLRDRSWFGRGYEYYIDPSLRRILRLNVTAEEINSRAIPWLRNHCEELFFMMLHYWEPHAPYLPPKRYRELFYSGDPTDPNNHSLEDWWKHPLGELARQTWLRTSDGLITDAEYIKTLYDQEIRHVDDCIAELISTLQDLNLNERTLVVIVSDHGESMTEHGIFFEHHGLYDCTIRVPLLFYWPGHLPGNTRLHNMLQYHDIAPTLLEACNLPVPSSMEGKSFWPSLTEKKQLTGRSSAVSLECSLQAKWSLRNHDYKFIMAREPDFYGNPDRELYNLVLDPHENRNIAEEKPDLVDAMEKELERWISIQLEILGKDKDPLREHGISLKAVMDFGV